jgi:hypothetical protein
MKALEGGGDLGDSYWVKREKINTVAGLAG